MNDSPAPAEEDSSELQFTASPHGPIPDDRPTMRLDDPAVDAELPKPRSRWPGRLVALAVLAGVSALVWFGPVLAAASPWRASFVAAVLPPIDGSLSVAEARFHWTEPVVLKGIEIRDPEGVRALTIDSVTVEKTLLRLALDRGALGVVRAVRPKVELHAANGATNYARVFDRWVRPPKDAPPGTPGPPLPRDLRLSIESGAWIVAALDETGRNVEYHLDDWNADLGLDLDRDGPWTASGKLREGSYSFVGRGAYEAGPGVFTIDELRVHSPEAPWALDTRGRLSVRPGQKTDLAGTIRYDLPTLAAALRPILGPTFALEGEGLAPFSVVTSPEEVAAAKADPAGAKEVRWLKPLTGGLDVAWKSATWSGVDVGPATAAARLDHAVVSIEIPKTDVSGGLLAAHASVDLLASEPTLVVRPGRVLQDFELTPRTCDGAMRFVLPALADTAQVSGRTTLDVEEWKLPLGDAGAGEVRGKLTIHAIEVGLNQNSLIQKIAGVLRVPGSIRLIDGAEVDFVMKNRRVESRGFRFRLGEVEVQIYGTVGLDESLALLAETSIPPTWLGDGPLATLLKSQNFRVPIGGTLQQPKIETERLGEVNSGLSHDLAGVLERGLSVGDEWAKGMGDRVRTGGGLLDVVRGLVEPQAGANNAPGDGAATGTPAATETPATEESPGPTLGEKIGERVLKGLGRRLLKRFEGDEPPPTENPPQ